MSSKSISPLLQTWYRWKMLRLPWRKRFLVGLDLNGNTYWEFRLARGDPTSSPTAQQQASEFPFRRIVHYPRSTHYSEIKVPPAWHQWLRYRRPDPPTLREQREDVVRQQRIKILAAEADKRWEAKASLLDMPEGAKGKQQVAEDGKGSGRAPEEEEAAEEAREKKDDPWKKAARPDGPGESWQPESWNPGSLAPRKR